MGGKGTIEVEVDVASEQVSFRIEDSGPGIDEEVRSRLFEPFFTTRPAGEGTGLGLAVCEQIVTAAGGTIACIPSRLGGAAFEVCFTLQPSVVA
jgi:signal transduction histidine kinase